MNVFRKRLVESMARKNLSVKELCKVSGLTNSTIYSYLNRDAVPNAFTLGCLADALDVSMDWLWGRD